jgi:hypothetical protein
LFGIEIKQIGESRHNNASSNPFPLH